MKKKINKVAIIGSGIMGSQIACHFANIGLEVILLDIIPKDYENSSIKKERNSLVEKNFTNTLKMNPSPIYSQSFANRITIGNLIDDISKLANYDWIIEAIIENLEIKKQLFEKLEKYINTNTIISSNTSGIPLNKLIEGRTEQFQKNFIGTHFFNPPRYLQLLEVIPSAKTDAKIVEFVKSFGEKYLGKNVVLCKDTPAFIANRIGVFSIQSIFHTVNAMKLSVGMVDKITGTIIGRPKSATFRTCDVVGLDTLANVSNGLKHNCLNDEKNHIFDLPEFISKMIENKFLGSKTKQGFYKKIEEDGNSKILELNLQTLEYIESPKSIIPSFGIAKNIDKLEERLKILYNADDIAGEFLRTIFSQLFSYISNRIPEIADEIYLIDDAIRSGFGWQLGPFEIWDILGKEKVMKIAISKNEHFATWIDQMKGDNFYKIENNKKHYYNIKNNTYEEIPINSSYLNINLIEEKDVVWKNEGVTLINIGDGILNLQFHTKMNTIGSEILEGINKAIDIAENDEKWKGIVIYNEEENFSAGANIGLIFMMAVNQEYEELDYAVRNFQQTMMRVRYSSIPVVVAPHNLTLGGACELCMHSDKVIAHAESYIGLVEFGVGLIPAGGGTKEMVLRLSDELINSDISINRLREKFLTIGQAKVSKSAYEAFELGYLRNGIDEVVVNRKNQLNYAKNSCLQLANNAYVRKPQRNDITVFGKEGLGIVYVGADSMKRAGYISEHDKYISEKLGEVMCGGNLSGKTIVNEQYLLDLERKVFVELCTNEKTIKRIESILNTGKILRN